MNLMNYMRQTTENKIKEHENRLNSYVRERIERLEEFFPGIKENDFNRRTVRTEQVLPKSTHEEV